jgi:hypothetical protein
MRVTVFDRFAALVANWEWLTAVKYVERTLSETSSS